VRGHFSVSVIDESQIPVDENAESTILTSLLLTSDLKGYVEQPNYYFAVNSNEVYNNLDLLMLTHGYRRFEWKQMIHQNNIEPVLAYQPERSLELSGMVKTLSGKPVPNGEITLIAADDGLVIDTVTDINGNFMFKDINITGNPTLVLRARKENKNDNVKIEVKEPDEPAITKTKYAGLDDIEVPQQAATLMQQRFIEMGGEAKTLKEVNIKGYKAPPKPIVEHSANLNGPGHANYVIMGDQLVNCTDLSCLYGKIPGTIAKNGALFLNRTGERLGEKAGFGPPPMVIILDGILFQQAQNPLSMLNISDINSVEVLTSGSYLAVYGSSASGGALIITTKQGGENAHKSIVTAPGLIRFPFKGFYKSRAFYSPRYDHSDDSFKQKDLRSTIYWKPELITDKDGKASFEYYNADGSGTYRLIIEGIDDAGNIGRQVYRYKVE
jgi:hypothetical protein